MTDAVARLMRVTGQRIDLLDQLRTGPHDKRTLDSTLDCSRSTINRGIRDLELLELVEYVDGRYSLTLQGRLAAEAYRRYERDLTVLREAAELLSYLPADCELMLDVLWDADFIVASPVAPHRPGTQMETLLEDADACRVLACAHSHPNAKDVITEQVVEEGMEMEVVLQTELYEYLQDAAADTLQRWKATGRYTAFTIDDLPFGLFLIETGDHTVTCVLVYDGQNQLHGIIRNKSHAACTWGEQVYEQYKARASKVTPKRVDQTV